MVATLEEQLVELQAQTPILQSTLTEAQSQTALLQAIADSVSTAIPDVLFFSTNELQLSDGTSATVTVAGLIDGINNVFTFSSLTHNIDEVNGIEINGVAISAGVFSYDSGTQTLTFNTAPPAGATIAAKVVASLI